MYPENASKDSRVAAYLSIEDAMEMLLESVCKENNWIGFRFYVASQFD